MASSGSQWHTEAEPPAGQESGLGGDLDIIVGIPSASGATLTSADSGSQYCKSKCTPMNHMRSTTKQALAILLF